MKPMLIIIRGISGSGKSTLSERLNREIGNFIHLEADMFFYDENGIYCFDIKKLKEAHNWCLNETRKNLLEGKQVIVSNTFTMMWEMYSYLELVKEINNVKLRVIKMETEYQNTHNVPEQIVKSMKERFEDYPNEIKYMELNHNDLLKYLI